jgi:CBS domain-containing protein
VGTMTLTVSDVMARSVVTAREDSSFKELVGLLQECSAGALPVVDAAGMIVGVVSEADLLLKEDLDLFAPHLFEGHVRRIEREKAAAVYARDLMTAPAVTIRPDAHLTDAAHLMHERRVKRLFVTDPNGRVLGVVSRMDLLRAYLREDRDIAQEVTRVLHAELLLPLGAVSVTVEDGVVRLEGQVERRTLAPYVAARIRAIEGVVDVEDHLSWEYDDTIRAGYGVGWVG